MDDDCPVCYNLLCESVKCSFECKHFLCLECNISLKNKQVNDCPICRKNIDFIIYSGGSKINISNIHGQTEIVNINLKHTSFDLIIKLLNQNYLKFTKFNSILVFEGKPLNLTKTCSWYNIKDNDTIYIIQKS